VAIGVAIALSFVIKIIVKLLAKHIKKFADKTESKWDDVIVDILEHVKLWVLLVWFFVILTKPFAIPKWAERAELIILVLASVFQVVLWGLSVIQVWRHEVLDKKIQQDPSSAAALGLLNKVVQTIFIVVVALVGLSHLGVDITALVAGLGVGGIAVALAAQNILADLLASLSIVLDKPFVIGDFIVAGGDYKGTVENIGIKTTRLRSISGEELVLSNKDLLESRIQNFKRMWRRRMVLKVGVTYSTSADTLEKIPVWITEIVRRHPRLEFDRCHLAGYGGSSLDYEMVCFVNDADYNLYMDVQQQILLEIYRKFTAEKVEFAFPSQSIYLEKYPEKMPREG
jgi:small-conductance mechanosensitive channel